MERVRTERADKGVEGENALLFLAAFFFASFLLSSCFCKLKFSSSEDSITTAFLADPFFAAAVDAFDVALAGTDGVAGFEEEPEPFRCASRTALASSNAVTRSRQLTRF
jgi:hypothetical protein